MIKNDKNNGRYDFRVVKTYDVVLDRATNNSSSTVYTLYECHYDQSGNITEMSVISDMTGYSRADATDFLLRVGAACLKPVLNKGGDEIEDGLVDTGQAVMRFIEGSEKIQ